MGRYEPDCTRLGRRFDRVGEILRRSAGTAVFGLVITSAALAAAGCTIPVRLGNPLSPRALEDSLVIGKSTPADVKAALGHPQAVGRSMLPIASKPRTIWFYNYGEGTTDDGRMTIILVLFDEDRYDGYFWVSSLPRVGH